MNSQEEKLIGSVESLVPEIVDLTKRLVAQPSTLGNEASALEVMEAELTKLGFTHRRIFIDPELLREHPGFGPVPWGYEGRYNIVAHRPADREGGKSALFNGHLDVVSPEPLERWDRDPFEPFESEGWLFGRGSGDMKSGVAAMTYALKAVDAAGFGLRAAVFLETVIEEECSGNGALACLNAGVDADAVLIPEPFGPTILTAQVGVVWFKVTLNGVPMHVLDAQGGVNAIEKCFPLFKALRNLEENLNRKVHPAFSGSRHPANLNIGIIKGGDWPSTVPAFAEFHCRLGFTPDIAYPEIRNMLEKTIAEASSADAWLSKNPPRIDFYGFRSEGHSISRDLPALKVLGSCQHDLSGRLPEDFVSTATTDLRTFVHFGQGQATCFGPVAKRIHAENECVNIDSIVHTAKVYALFLLRWCKSFE
ncbi:MAG: ArgE/DapE family deacylase [Deltaproteobacteria bacterium]|nr:ArgE/DapE family deacylase [Deltaproteobacteria bacterium]